MLISHLNVMHNMVDVRNEGGVDGRSRVNAVREYLILWQRTYDQMTANPAIAGQLAVRLYHDLLAMLPEAEITHATRHVSNQTQSRTLLSGWDY